MATPAEIAALIEQAWSLDPEEHFFEFLYDLMHTNETLFSLGGTTNEQIHKALTDYIAAGGADGETSGTDTAPVEADTSGDTPSEA